MVGPAILVVPAINALLAYGGGGEWNVWDMGFFAFLGLIGVVATVYGFAPAVLIADQQGIHYRTLGYRRSYPWDEIESIGVSRDRAFDGWDAPAARAVVGHVSRPPATIGLNLKIGDRNAAKVAYARGVNGYEFGFPDTFEKSTHQIARELQGRLEQSRNVESGSVSDAE